MNVAEHLRQAAQSHDGAALDEILNQSFFKLAITDSELVRTVLRELPAVWYAEHPSHTMSRAMIEALSSPEVFLRQDALASYEEFVSNLDSPTPRDVLVLRQAKLLELLGMSRYGAASNEVDAILDYVDNIPEQTAALNDVMPGLLLCCGVAKILHSDLDGATACFAEADRWSRHEFEHPVGRYAREHLALVHALNESYSQASALLGDAEEEARSAVVRYRLRSTNTLVRTLVAIGQLDLERAERLLEDIDDSTRRGGFGWVVLHAEAQLAVARKDPGGTLHRISRYLELDPRRAGPATLSGAILRADQSALFQMSGDLRAADRTLRTPGLLRSEPYVLVALVRQSILLGRPEQAMALLHADEASHGTTVPARLRPSGAVLYASAELSLSGEAGSSAQRQAASSVLYDGARSALMGASSALRQHLLPGLGETLLDIPAPWHFRARVKLTRREKEVLQALAAFRTLNEVAASLHVTLNTAKTHVRALYRKLGVHNREDALWMGRDLARR